MNIDYETLIKDSKELAKKIPKEKYDSVFGIPNGGILPAFIIAQELGLPLIQKKQITLDTLIVDDLIDSGKTIEELNKNCAGRYGVAVLYKKEKSPEVNYFLKEVGNDWINLPHEDSNFAIENNIIRLLEFLGEDPKREGLKDTPKRVIKSYLELFSGYKKNVKDVLTVFDGENYDQMILLKDIELYSTCEHHMLPFVGKCHIAYIPNSKVIGLSKLARVVEVFSRRLQVQERLTTQIAEALQEVLNPKGVAVVIEAQHFCMKARGVNKQNSVMKTAHLTGIFKTQKETRQEFYSIINKS